MAEQVEAPAARGQGGQAGREGRSSVGGGIWRHRHRHRHPARTVAAVAAQGGQRCPQTARQPPDHHARFGERGLEFPRRREEREESRGKELLCGRCFCAVYVMYYSRVYTRSYLVLTYQLLIASMDAWMYSYSRLVYSMHNG